MGKLYFRYGAMGASDSELISRAISFLPRLALWL